MYNNNQNCQVDLLQLTESNIAEFPDMSSKYFVFYLMRQFSENTIYHIM